jgi:hypothetical protein
VTLGARTDDQWSSTGTPFFLRPFVMLRGVPALRCQGDQLASAEVEARWEFHGRSIDAPPAANSIRLVVPRPRARGGGKAGASPPVRMPGTTAAARVAPAVGAQA